MASTTAAAAAAAAAAVVRRALLYVPSSSPKMLDKSRALPYALVDNVTYDLEDSVTPGKKPEARTALARFLSQPRARPSNVGEQAVRINAVDSGLALADLTEILRDPSAAKNVDAVVVPKVNSAADLQFVTDVIRHVLPERHPSSTSSSSPLSSSSSSSSSSSENQQSQPQPIKLLALVESARSLTSLPQICASTPLLSGLIFAAEDFALDLSLTRTPSLTEFLYARSAIATAARAFNLPSTIDLVCTAYKTAEAQRALEEECRGGKGLGFNGKQCIHPSQVEAVQLAFAPSDAELQWAVRVCVADRKAQESGRGAWTLEGKMVDAPVVGLARRIVSRAEGCGLDVGAVWEKWEGQEPE